MAAATFRRGSFHGVSACGQRVYRNEKFRQQLGVVAQAHNLSTEEAGGAGPQLRAR